MRGLWQTSIPSRFIQELPADHIEADEFAGPASGRAYGLWPSAGVQTGFASRYDTPGWRRAEARRDWSESGAGGLRSPGRIFEGAAQRQDRPASAFHAGSRVFHNKFGPGAVVAVDGAKLTVDFDKAGRKLVMDSFVAAES